ncbi:hypothetical protein BC567DRAFT_209134 [Phyllosticta citribraziliensis]
MAGYLEFNLKEQFKAIKCLLVPAEIQALSRFKKKRVASFPNLSAIALMCSKNRREPHNPSGDDVEFWAEAIRQIKRPLKAYIYSQKGACGVKWTGSYETSDKLLFSTFSSREVMIGCQDLYCKKRWFSSAFTKMLQIQPRILGRGLKSLDLSSTSVSTEDIRRFCSSTSALEALSIVESDIACSHFWVPNGCQSSMIRSLRIVSCKIRYHRRRFDHTDVQIFFSGLKEYGKLKSLQFEKVGDIVFDWDYNGSEDDGGRLRSISAIQNHYHGIREHTRISPQGISSGAALATAEDFAVWNPKT